MSATLLLVLRLGLSVSLYAFLGWTLYTLWHGLRAESLQLAGRNIPPIILKADGEALEFMQPEITIGRDPLSEILLAHETVSALHARLTHHHGQWWLEDLGSTNGTKLNQQPISTPTVVISGDVIHCGSQTITIQLGKDILSPPTEQVQMEQL